MRLILVLDCSVASVIKVLVGFRVVVSTWLRLFSDSKKGIFTLLYRKIPYLHISSHQSSVFYYILMHLGIFAHWMDLEKEGSVKSVLNAKHLLFLLSHSEAQGIFSSSEGVLSLHVEQKKKTKTTLGRLWWISVFFDKLCEKKWK